MKQCEKGKSFLGWTAYIVRSLWRGVILVGVQPEISPALKQCVAWVVLLQVSVRHERQSRRPSFSNGSVNWKAFQNTAKQFITLWANILNSGKLSRWESFNLLHDDREQNSRKTAFQEFGLSCILHFFFAWALRIDTFAASPEWLLFNWMRRLRFLMQGWSSREHGL